MLTYDDLWNRTQYTASAVKAAYPNTLIQGYVSWGYCDILFSHADGCSPGNDYASHNNMYLSQWYAQQVCNYESQTGVRLVDYLGMEIMFLFFSFYISLN